LIGVLSRPEQTAVIEEFFELFKTPWEIYREDGVYDVVLATSVDALDVRASLLLVFSAASTAIDVGCGAVPHTIRSGGSVDYRGATAVPLYGSVLSFEPLPGSSSPLPSGAVVVETALGDLSVIRVGYDLFEEVRYLLTIGQPASSAHIPTLDLHIAMLREWIVGAGVPLIEIPPTPAGHPFAVCLTHDIDFVGIKRHRLDHSVLGFLYRATLGAVRHFARRRLSFHHLVRSWLAAASLPFIHLGWAKDFWDPFEWYLQVETGLPATYFLIPYKRRAGDKVPGSGRVSARRATAYDVDDITSWTSILQREGCELGVHGIDAWHSVERGRDESARLSAVTGASSHGIRMHWLLHDADTASALDQAGYVYDSTVGYNETVGYRSGTGQVFRPLGARTLLELPLHIQDGALFYPQRLDLSEPAAWERCEVLLQNARNFSGVLTLLWHDRSHGPERFWGAFYVALIAILKQSGAWFGSASQVVSWFRHRRTVRFERQGSVIHIRQDGGPIEPPLIIRRHQSASNPADTHWNGVGHLALEVAPSRPSGGVPIALCSQS
jgi:hypothetical protein